jgi:tetratricopeptide (TPR) repeat protein
MRACLVGCLMCGCLIVSAAASRPVLAAKPQPSSASSAEKAAADVRARELFQKGDAAYAEGRYEEALSAFQEAYDLSSRPQLLFNVSNALERLGRYAEAVEALEKYLANTPKARDRDVVQKRLANLKKRVETQKKDEAAKAADDEKKKKEEEDKSNNSGTNKQPGNGEAVTKSPAPPPPPPAEKPTPVLPIALIGIGGAALVTSGIFGVLTLSARSDVEAGCKDGPAGRLCDANAQSAIDRDKTFGLITDITLVSGVIIAGLGVYLLLTSNPKEAPSKGAVKVGVRGLGGTF